MFLKFLIKKSLVYAKLDNLRHQIIESLLAPHVIIWDLYLLIPFPQSRCLRFFKAPWIIEIILLFGQLHFRCSTTWPWSSIKFEISTWSKIPRVTQKSEWALRNEMHISFFVKKRFHTTLNSATKWSESRNFWTKFSSVKNYLKYVIFKLIGPFIGCSIFAREAY